VVDNLKADRESDQMQLTLIPKVFYRDVSVGLDLFVTGLRFTVLYRDEDLVVAGRDGIKIYLVEDGDFADKDRPELCIETDNIDGLYADLSTRRPDLLHPNGNTVQQRAWGSREFALRDRSDVCVVFREWSS
jgi:hypothetical protein